MTTRYVIGDASTWKNEGELFHAILCDPPYHLESIVKRFGKPGSAPATEERFARFHRGFMGQAWDGGGVAFRPETWAALGENLYPGGFGMAFASAKGWHRLACAIEDAGMVIRPSIFGWVYGQGFPKATRVKGNKVFDGHRYGGQALKPAVEPIIVFQKPYEGKPVENIVRTGAGVLNIDGARIGTKEDDSYRESMVPDGRHPANFYVEHSPECRDDSCADDCPAGKLDKQSGERAPGRGGLLKAGFQDSYVGGKSHNMIECPGYADSGGASRYFERVETALEEADPVLYCPKAPTSEREAGLWAEKPTKSNYRPNDSEESSIVTRLNPHPTVKPIKLTTWLAKLLLPPAEYAPRRLLVPFAGVASEMIGGVLAGWDEVVGLELSQGYAEVGEKRIRYWCD